MPAGKETGGGGDGTVKRTTFRPPWVKEGPNPLPAAPSEAWNLKKAPRRDSNTNSDTSEKEPYNALAEVQLKPTKVNKKPEPEENGEGVRKNKILGGVQLRKTKKAEPKEPAENGAKESFFQKPALKPVPQREKSPPKKDHKIHNLPTLQKASERVLRSPPRKPSNARSDSYTSEEESDDEDDAEIDKEVPKKRNALVREASMRKLSQSNIPPPPPLLPGMPPPPPKMPGELPKKPLTDKQKSRLNKLKARPKNRPDWSNLLQEIEAKKTLKHVVCNDRSSPLLPEAKTADEHLIYKSEEANVHNELLKQIEKGVCLKKVKTNDRSRPVLDGLRKFRRQMTIEEQIQKSISMASMPPEEVTTDEIDEMDDIDKVRDDLQSTKQMLALELRNKEAQERENKRLLARLQNLEAELEKEKDKKDGGKPASGAGEKVIQGLKKEADEARRTSQELEKKYNKAAEELDSAKAKMDELKRQNQMLEKKLQESMLGKRFSLSDRKLSGAGNGSEDIEDEEPEEESDGEDTEEKQDKRSAKEVKQLRKKLQSLKTKQDNAKKERTALRDIIKKHQTEMKEEKKKYKQLKKEVDKMASLMKDAEEEEEEEEPEEEEESEDEDESSEEEESESESDTDSEKSQSEDEDAPNEKKKTNLSARTKRHENILNALKKCNFLLKTNAERLQDDLNKQKEMTASLQEDLDSVLSELG